MADQRKTVLITGTSSGIGHSLAKEFHARGLRVFATARTTDRIADLAALGIETLPLEVTDPASIGSLYASIKSLLGPDKGLDYLVNNAGRNYTMPATDVDFNEVQQVFEVNLFGVMRMCQTFVPLLIKAKGTVVQIGSVAGVVPYVFGASYNASKAALHAYSNTLRTELQPFGVKVVVIVTGGIVSEIARVDRHLPSDSLFLDLGAQYERRVKHSQDGAMSSETYAKSVVSQVLRRDPPLFVWEGHWATVIRVLTTIFGRGDWGMRVFDSIFWKMFQLWRAVPGNSKVKYS